MNNNLTINLQNVSDEDKKILMEIIESSNKPKNKVWKLVEGETVYVLWSRGEITSHTYYPEFLLLDYEQGNVFPTKDSAEFECERRKILKRWKDLSIESGESENEWDGVNTHWGCYYNTLHDCLGVCFKRAHREGNIYFPNKESLESAIKALGEDNVKKYILGVNE